MASTCLLLASGASVTDPQEKPWTPGSGELPWWTTLYVCRQPLSCVSSWGALEAVPGLPQTCPHAFPGLTLCPFALTN